MVGLKKCAFMTRHVGEEFVGTVTGVARHGLFVMLDGVQVDGLIHKSRLGKRFRLDAEGLILSVGHRHEKSRQRYRLGDRIRVRVEQVEIERGWIRLAPILDPESPRRDRRLR
jgi:ribonuclease R